MIRRPLFRCKAFDNANCPSARGSFRRRAAVWISAALLCVCAATVWYLKNAGPIRPSVLFPEAENAVSSAETASVPTKGIRIPGYKSITVDAGAKKVAVPFGNPAQNECYFVIRLVLSDTGETLYESEMLAPGKRLTSVTLTRALKKGTYPARLEYEPYDPKTLTRLNGATVRLDLIAE